MKKLIHLCIIATLLLVACQKEDKEVYMFTSFHEPTNEGLRFLYSEDGMNWDSIPGVWLKPEIGTQKVMRDPSIVRTPDGTYHLVWTSSWRGDLGFGYAQSKDLVHWSEQKMIPVMAYDTTTVNVWAPELFYDDELDEMMVVWASCIPGAFDYGIEDERNNHRQYYMTTKDFETFSETKLLIDPGYSSIDAVILKRAPEDYVMVIKDNTRPQRNLQISFAASPHGPWSQPGEYFTEKLTEGPGVAKVGDEYIVYYDDYGRKEYGAKRTVDFVNFTDVSDEVNIPKGHKHGTIFKAPISVVNEMLNQRKTN